jgi:hypothetical protein
MQTRKQRYPAVECSWSASAPHSRHANSLVAASCHSSSARDRRICTAALPGVAESPAAAGASSPTVPIWSCSPRSPARRADPAAGHPKLRKQRSGGGWLSAYFSRMLAALAVGVVVRPAPEATWKALAAAEPLTYQERSSSQWTLATLRDAVFTEPPPGARCSTDACYWLGPSAPEKVRGGELSGVDVRSGAKFLAPYVRPIPTVKISLHRERESSHLLSREYVRGQMLCLRLLLLRVTRPPRLDLTTWSTITSPSCGACLAASRSRPPPRPFACPTASPSAACRTAAGSESVRSVCPPPPQV